MQILKELGVTVGVGVLIGLGVILSSAFLGFSIPAPDDRPVFLVGSALLALCFRVLMILREEE